MELSDPVTKLKGVGEELAKKLDTLGIKTVGDLIENWPRRYSDFSQVLAVKDLRPGQVTIKAAIGQLNGRYVRRGMHITEAIASDETASVRLVWFNQPYRAGALKKGQNYYIAGTYQLSRQRFSIMNPSVELVSDFPVNTARIIPIYRETRGLKSAQIRKLIREALDIVKTLPEQLPSWIIEKQGLMAYKDAVSQMHFPSSSDMLDASRHRLAFEEIFDLSLAALLNKRQNDKEKSLTISFSKELARDFVAKLPFKLTNAQRKVVWQIYQDLSKLQPMNRLVEGDVGSGKTVVAAMAALMAMEQGFQVAFMAPTEILARQHAESLYQLLDSIGFGSQVGLLVGSLKSRVKSLMHQKIASGEVKLVVGTQALISEKVDMQNLGLVVVDEQHRFGVDQRKSLQAKARHMPHVLHMTATPIPRSLALTVYGNLDISVLDELPRGRHQIETKIVSPNSAKQLYRKIDAQIEEGRQVFVICPLIAEGESTKNLSAESVYHQLSEHEFKYRRVGLLHGRRKAEDKEEVMNEFSGGNLDILVSTTVVEVGVDIPNASVMLIMAAERFGLAQIHQLRGRVGRGAHKSYCYLVSSDSQAPTQRLEALETMSDGFKLAELDLKLRGPGAIYGTMQHGVLDLRVANLSDAKLISAARSSAQKFIDQKGELSRYPYLEQKIDKLRSITNLN